MVKPASRPVRPQAERYTAVRAIALASGSKSGSLSTTMEADATKACNQDDATGFVVALSLRLNRSRHSLDATSLAPESRGEGAWEEVNERLGLC